jgi:hypothetical protein
VGIVEGLNPTLIRMKLEAYNPNPRKPKRAAVSEKAGKIPAGAKTANAPQGGAAGD